MKNWLKKSLATVFAIGALTVPNLASAQSCGPNYCDPCGDWDASNFFITSSTLYWKPCANNTEYAVSATGATFTDSDTPLLTTFTGGKTHDVDMNWDWGFRIGAGYKFPNEGWDFRLNWTSLHTRHHASTTVPTGGVLFPSTMNPALVGEAEATAASSHAKLNYDTLDILFSRECCFYEDLFVRPFFGARVLWLHQRLHNNYTGGAFTGPDDGLLWDSKYTAGGLHTGMDFNVGLGCDFFVIAKAAASLVAGDNKGHQTQTITAVGPAVSDFDITEGKGCLVSFGYELSLGLEYRTCLCECWNVDWALTYDFVHWDNVPEMVRYYGTAGNDPVVSSGGRHGSIGFHGVSFSSIWRF